MDKKMYKFKKKIKVIKINWQLYLLMLPALVVLIWFRYIPIYGLQIAFKDYNLVLGITKSPWAGFEHFESLFSNKEFWNAFQNTIIINFLRIIFTFPLPIILAIMINECKSAKFKRIAQSISYLPHFLSWVIIAAIFNNLLALDTGIINQIISFLGFEQKIFLADVNLFRGVLIITDIWKSCGWSSIIYLASMMAIDSGLYEAASIDGASKLKKIWYITLPGIKSTMVFILIQRIGNFLVNDVEQVLMLYNTLVYDTGDVIGTYIYRMGIGQMKYSYTTAAGMFSSVIGITLIIFANKFAHKIGDRGLW